MSKNSILRAKTENIKFVQKVEKYLVLYDKTIECYSQKSEVDDAWNQVADYMKTSVSECKKKWVIICENLKRNLCERESTNKKKVKHYYLVPYLKFLIPFIKNRKINSAATVEEKTSKYSDDSIDNIDDDQTEDIEDLDLLREAKRKEKENECYDSAIKYDNADMSFLRSLLPDLELMNTQQKQKFKIGVLSLIKDIQEQSEKHESESNSNLKISIVSKQEFIIKQEDNC